jgi:hypothetical protein
MLFMFADVMAKDQADAIEKRRAKLFLCEKIKLVDDSCLVVLCGFSLRSVSFHSYPSYSASIYPRFRLFPVYARMIYFVSSHLRHTLFNFQDPLVLHFPCVEWEIFRRLAAGGRERKI